MVKKNYYAFLRMEDWKYLVFNSDSYITENTSKDFVFVNVISSENAFSAATLMDIQNSDWSVATLEEAQEIIEQFKMISTDEMQSTTEGEQTAQNGGTTTEV